jgi:hypothetical protein
VIPGLKMCKCRTLAHDESNGVWIHLFSLKWSLPSPFIDSRGTQSYMHALRDIFPRKEDPRPPPLPCSWWRATVGGVALSFDAVAMCPDICGSVDDATTTCRVVTIPMAMCMSLRFNWHRGPRSWRRESWRDLIPFEGIGA